MDRFFRIGLVWRLWRQLFWRHRRHVLFLHGHVTVPFCGVCRHFSQPPFAALHLFWQLCCPPRSSTCFCSSVGSSAARRAVVLASAVPLPAVQWRLLTRLGPLLRTSVCLLCALLARSAWRAYGAPLSGCMHSRQWGLQPPLYTANRGGSASRFRVRPVLVVVLRLLEYFYELRTTSRTAVPVQYSSIHGFRFVCASCVVSWSTFGRKQQLAFSCLLFSPPSHPFCLINWRHRRQARSAWRAYGAPFSGCMHSRQWGLQPPCIHS